MPLKLKEARDRVCLASQLSLHRADFQLLVEIPPPPSLNLLLIIEGEGGGRAQRKDPGPSKITCICFAPVALFHSSLHLAVWNWPCDLDPWALAWTRPSSGWHGVEYHLPPPAQPRVDEEGQFLQPRPRGASTLLSERQRWLATLLWWSPS